MQATLIVPKLDSVSINKFLVKICYCESFIESKFDAKFVNTGKSTTYEVCVFKSNRMFRAKNSKTK